MDNAGCSLGERAISNSSAHHRCGASQADASTGLSPKAIQLTPRSASTALTLPIRPAPVERDAKMEAEFAKQQGAVRPAAAPSDEPIGALERRPYWGRSFLQRGPDGGLAFASDPARSYTQQSTIHPKRPQIFLSVHARNAIAYHAACSATLNWQYAARFIPLIWRKIRKSDLGQSELGEES